MTLVENQRKLDAVEALEQLATNAGLPLIELALRFVASHPAVSSCILGPRTLDQLTAQLSAETRRLDDSILDEIDRIVEPGITLNPSDAGWISQEVETAALRRRS